MNKAHIALNAGIEVVAIAMYESCVRSRSGHGAGADAILLRYAAADDWYDLKPEVRARWRLKAIEMVEEAGD